MENSSHSGTRTFGLEVPYELIDTGRAVQKPLVIYLHGYRQNITYFKKKLEKLQDLEAYHLFVQGPYPIYDEEHRRAVPEWGRAWYLYDGRQDQFRRSMERSSAFIEYLVRDLIPELEVSYRVMLGYSMGGYLAGYFALSRPGTIQKLIVLGGRIKSEWFEEDRYSNFHVLALHGKNDKSVDAGHASKSCLDLEKRGADVTFRKINTGHKLNSLYVKEVWDWLAE